ncbi:MAG: energy transducer TonB family protein [Terracidiphilus sp.]
MPSDQAPTDVNEPSGAENTACPEAGVALDDATASAAASPPEILSAGIGGSRWVDYDTHELLQMISDLEDERRWARLREGFWIAILIHLALLSAFTWIPAYLFREPKMIDPFDAIQERKDLTYLDLPPDALRKAQPRAIKPAPQKPIVVDKQTLEELKRMSQPAPEPPAPVPAPAPAQPAPPSPPVEQSHVEAPRPAAVPARPDFAMNDLNPADQLRQAMRNAARSSSMGPGSFPSRGELTMHPGAGTGGVQVLSDTQGVDFTSWLERWHYETERTWDPLIPDEVNPPINKSGEVLIRFKVLPNGRLMDGSVVLEGSSGDVALDRAAWGALTGSNYPPLPRAFHGPYLELRALFMYNMGPPQ